MLESEHFVEVAVPLPLRKAFTYSVPPEMQPLIRSGKRVVVPFGRKSLPGFVLGPARKFPEGKKILPIRQVLDDEFSLSEKFLSFLVWVAQYYFQPIGEVIKAALPAGLDLSYRETYGITEKGTQSAKSFPAGSLERMILNSLQRKGGKTPLKRFIEKHSSLNPVLTIERMLTEGYIIKVEDFFKEKSSKKTESYIKFLNKKEDSCSLNPTEMEAINLIEKEGEIGIQQFKVKYQNSASIIRKFIKNSLIEIVKKEIFRQPSWEGIENWLDGPPLILTDSQKEAIEAIHRSIRAENRQPFLLHGVTGSGKTEVYWRVIEEVIGQGEQALLLVPEIALTTQLMAYFRSRCNYPMAILHSGLSPGERLDEWRRIKKGLVKLVIGVRSAIFAPLNRLGMIVVDEEHDPSYKQEEKVRYHARDLALVRGKMENAVVVLGSATPSLESYFNALQKKFSLLTLPTRIDGRPLPEIRVTDMRQEKAAGKERLILSQALEEALHQNAERGEQTILFLNRRGFSTFTLCRDCGFVYRCPNCSVSLIYHLTQKSYRCHYCDYSLPTQACCPQCSSPGLMLFGAGTQRLEEEIKKKLPQVQMARMDRDTMTRKLSHRRVLNLVRRGEVNLLIGTQMITKGHDLPGVTLVGVLAADLSLNIPDFRASERTFQLLTQVAGRSGRGALPGKVIIQTYNPDHYSIQLAKHHDFGAFYQQETEFRREMNYPPYARLINLRWEGNTEARVLHHARAVACCAQEILTRAKKWQGQVDILGPTLAPLARLRGKSRCQLLFKGKNWALLHEFAGQILEKAEEISTSGVKMVIDVDPVNML